MIPTEEQIKALWIKYRLPVGKRKHMEVVARVAGFIADKLDQLGKFDKLDKPLLIAGALLHDIDKKVPRSPGEQHPDTAVRILKEEGMDEVALLVEKHPLHVILDPAVASTTLVEKILFLADKMVKFDYIGVDERFRLWNEEHLAPDAQKILDTAYPKVKALEQEIFSLCKIGLRDIK